MKKTTIKPDDNIITTTGSIMLILSLVISVLYISLNSHIEMPGRYGYPEKIVNTAGIIFGLAIGLIGTTTSAILFGIGKCWGELTAIRILMNEEAGRVEPATNESVAEESTYEPQAPEETKHP